MIFIITVGCGAPAAPGPRQLGFIFLRPQGCRGPLFFEENQRTESYTMFKKCKDVCHVFKEREINVTCDYTIGTGECINGWRNSPVRYKINSVWYLGVLTSMSASKPHGWIEGYLCTIKTIGSFVFLWDDDVVIL